LSDEPNHGLIHAMDKSMLIATVPLLFSIVALIVFFAANNPKTVQAAIVSYGCGILVTLLSLMSGHAIHLP
jgi:hypothetical protein